MRKLVTMCDPEGMPRAYGIAPKLEDARRIAQEQLAVYRKKKSAVGDDYLATAEYTEKVEDCE